MRATTPVRERQGARRNALASLGAPRPRQARCRWPSSGAWPRPPAARPPPCWSRRSTGEPSTRPVGATSAPSLPSTRPLTRSSSSTLLVSSCRRSGFRWPHSTGRCRTLTRQPAPPGGACECGGSPAPRSSSPRWRTWSSRPRGGSRRRQQRHLRRRHQQHRQRRQQQARRTGLRARLPAPLPAAGAAALPPRAPCRALRPPSSA
mmetsp:Transcript_21363/g.81482  ORF Transcript_21363/g.81482 Transcript_21363/m.81482 type:complete len:205 (-) Transcript_21363:727-1341(-)